MRYEIYDEFRTLLKVKLLLYYKYLTRWNNPQRFSQYMKLFEVELVDYVNNIL